MATRVRNHEPCGKYARHDYKKGKCVRCNHLSARTIEITKARARDAFRSKMRREARKVGL